MWNFFKFFKEHEQRWLKLDEILTHSFSKVKQDTSNLFQWIQHLDEKTDRHLNIQSHIISHFLPPKYVKICIITHCDLKTLKKRLEKKGYSQKKVRENLDAEIFEICYQEAKAVGHKTLLIDTTNISPKSAAKKILRSKKL